MSILKFEHRTPRNLRQMYEHIVDHHKTDPDLIFGIGLNPLSAIDDMNFIKKIYYKEHLAHPYIHVIFSFDYNVCAQYDLFALKKICQRIGYMLLVDKRQLVAAIHYKTTDNVHCHYLINSVGIDGSIYEQKFSVIFYKKRINNILEQYEQIDPIYYYNMARA